MSTTIATMMVDNNANNKKATNSDKISTTVSDSTTNVACIEDSGSDGDSGKKRKISSITTTTANDKEESKREYNRLNAARNRQRQKERVAKLKSDLQLAEVAYANEKRQNEILKAKVKVFVEQNERLTRDIAASNNASMPNNYEMTPRQGEAYGSSSQITMNTAMQFVHLLQGIQAAQGLK